MKISTTVGLAVAVSLLAAMAALAQINRGAPDCPTANVCQTD